MGNIHRLAQSIGDVVHHGLWWCSHSGAIEDRSASQTASCQDAPMATKWVNVESIGSYFESLSDPRHTRNRKHLLVDVVVIAVCGMCAGAMVRRPSIAGRRIALIGCSSSSRFPTEFPRAIAFVAC